MVKNNLRLQGDPESRVSVAHFRDVLFHITETFIYNQVVYSQRTRPVLMSWARINRDLFPFNGPEVEVYGANVLKPARWSMKWISRVVRRCIFHNPFQPTYDLPIIFEAIEHFGVRALHAHFGWTGWHVIPIKRSAGLPLITTFYGHDISRYPRDVQWKQRYNVLFEVGDQFLVEGPFMRDALTSLGCPAEKIELQRIVIPVAKYPFRERKPPHSKEKIHILFCGSFREKKGLLQAIDAVSKVRPSWPGIEFRIIGDGPLRPQVETRVAARGLRDCAVFLGVQSHRDMIAEMNAADIFIHPSLTARDGDSEGGAPTVILEAQACGLPVLSTTHADIPNITLSGESALLVGEGDVDELAEALSMLLSEPERWSDMGRAGREFVTTYHDVESQIPVIENRYLAFTR